MKMPLCESGRSGPFKPNFYLSLPCRLVFLITCLAATSLSAEVYKWVDEKGKTHYSDKPVNENAETVEIKKTPALDAGHKSRVEKQRRLLKVLDEERQETKQQKAEAKAEKLKRKTNCAKARKELQEIKSASFLYKESSDPRNPLVYSDAERSKFTEDAENAVQHWCK